MKKIVSLLLLSCLFRLSTVAAQEETCILFDNTNSEVPYRIPAIAQNKDGDLIAVCDYRYSKSDIGVVKNGKVDLLYRIKDAKTDQWGPINTLIAAFGEGDANVAFGDPCIVADRSSDKVLVMSCVGNVSFQKGTHENHQGVARFISDDGGKTWNVNEEKGYVDIGDKFLSQLDKKSNGPVRAFFVASGNISQSKVIKMGEYYRIYCALLVKDFDGTYVNYVFFSDDFGKDWHLLGNIDDCPVPKGGDEAKTVELPDGSVVISSRTKGGRIFNIFRYSDVSSGEGKWDKPFLSDASVKGVNGSMNDCNGEILCIPAIRNTDMQPCYIILQSIPMDPNGDRALVGIAYKELFPSDLPCSPETLAKDWDGSFVIYPGSSAYSTMILNRDKKISFFYEADLYNGGFDLVYRVLPLEEVTDNKYSVRP